MDWQGIRDDLTGVIDSGLSEAVNVSFYVDQELRLRPGFYGRMDATGDCVAELADPVNGKYFVVARSSTGKVNTIKASTGAVATAYTGLKTGLICSQARSGGRLYLGNGYDKMLVLEDGTATATQAGITAPSGTIGAGTTGTGSTSAGTHRVRYRYYNSKTGYYSDPSGALAVTTTATNGKVTFAVASTGTDITRSTESKVDQIKLEATLVDGTVYYVAATVANTATAATLDIADLSLQLQAVLGEGTGNSPPPLFDTMVEHRGRLFGIGAATVSLSGVVASGSATVTGTGFSTGWAGRLFKVDAETTRYTITTSTATAITLSSAYSGTSGTKASSVLAVAPDLLYWSSPTLPEGWDTTSQAVRVLQNQADTPAALASYYDDLYIFGQRTVRRLVYATDPASGKLEHLTTDTGVWNQRCIVEAEGRLFGWGRNGLWVLEGIMPKRISRPVDDSVRAIMDASQYAEFHCMFDPIERSINCFFTRTGDTKPQDALCFDLARGQFSLRTWRQAIIGSATVATDDGVTTGLLSDNNGYSWFVSRDYFDGPAKTDTASVTADSGATTTVIPINETGPTDPVGMMVYRVSTGEERIISAGNSGSFTVSVAFGSAIAEGEAFYIGSIPMTATSKWLSADDMSVKKRPTHIDLSFVSQTAGGEIRVYTYKDFSGTANTYTKLSTDVHANGVTIVDGLTYATVSTATSDNTDGYAPVPMPSDFSRVWKWKLYSEEPAGDLRIIACKLGAEGMVEKQE